MPPIIIKYKYRTAYLLFILLVPIFSIAQEDFPQDAEDMTPAGPINNYIVLGNFVAIYIALRFLKIQRTKFNKININ